MPPNSQTKTHNPFERPTKPKNSWELLKSAIFDYQLFEVYEKTLTGKEQRAVILKSYIWTFFISSVIWIIMSMLTAYFDLPNLFSKEYQDSFYEGWQKTTGFVSKSQYYLLNTWYLMIIIFVLGIVFIFEKDLRNSELHISMLYFVLSTSFVLVGGLTSGLAISLVLGTIWGGVFGVVDDNLSSSNTLVGYLSKLLTENSTTSLLYILANRLMGILFTGLQAGLTISILLWSLFDTEFSLSLSLSMLGVLMYVFMKFLMFFRLFPFYLYYQIASFSHSRLDKNPYIKDRTILLPIRGLQKKLTQQAQENPQLAQQFINFLLQYRPLQRKLAMHLTHAANSGKFQQNPIKTKTLALPKIAEDHPKFEVSEKWNNLLQQTKETLQTALEQNNLSLKKKYFEAFVEKLTQLAFVKL